MVEFEKIVAGNPTKLSPAERDIAIRYWDKINLTSPADEEFDRLLSDLLKRVQR